MTEAAYKANHIALWQWLYDNPDEKKCEWPGWNDQNWCVYLPFYISARFLLCVFLGLRGIRISKL
jgi:hypothetical protein